MTDEQVAAELRHALAGARVAYDPSAVDAMISNATSAPLHPERTAWAAPVAAAAAVIVIGGGAALFATHGSGGNAGAPAGGGGGCAASNGSATVSAPPATPSVAPSSAAAASGATASGATASAAASSAPPASAAATASSAPSSPAKAPASGPAGEPRILSRTATGSTSVAAATPQPTRPGTAIEVSGVPLVVLPSDGAGSDGRIMIYRASAAPASEQRPSCRSGGRSSTAGPASVPSNGVGATVCVVRTKERICELVAIPRGQDACVIHVRGSGADHELVCTADVRSSSGAATGRARSSLPASTSVAPPPSSTGSASRTHS